MSSGGYYKSGDEVRASEAILRALKKAVDTVLVQLDAGKAISDETMHNLRISSNSLGTLGAKFPPTLPQLKEIARDIKRLRVLQDFGMSPEVLKYEVRKIESKISVLEILSDRTPLHERVQLDLPPYDEKEKEVAEEVGFIGRLKRKVTGKK